MSAKANELVEQNLRGTEEWREYDWEGRSVPYRIENPVTLWYRPGGSTHRVLDEAGVTHCIPAPGERGCALRWKGQTTF